MDRRDRALEAYLVASAKAGDRAAIGELARLRGPRLAESAALDAAQIILKSRGIE